MTIKIRAVSCGMIQENAYVVRAEGRDDCVVIDPGDDFPALKRAVGESRLAAILLTHGHFDHTLGRPGWRRRPERRCTSAPRTRTC